MRGRLLTFSHLKLLLLLVAATGLIARALVPDGYMVARDTGHAEFVITLCNSDGVQQMVLDPQSGALTAVDDTNGDDDTPPSHDTGPCVYTITQLATMEGHKALQQPAAVMEPVVVSRLQALRVQSTWAAAPLPPRGPPLA